MRETGQECVLESKYIRTMQKNELLLWDGNVSGGPGYYGKMLAYNRIQGILPFSEETTASGKQYRYTIGTKKSLAERYENNKVNHEQLEALIRGLINVIKRGKEYLIDEDDYVLSPEFVFFGGDTEQIYLCCYPFYQKDIHVQMTGLFEYLLCHIDYQDMTAVRIAYELYMKSEEKGYGFADMLEILDRKERQDSTEYREGAVLQGEEDRTEDRTENRLQARKEDLVEEGYYLQAEKKENSIRIRKFPYTDSFHAKISMRGGGFYIEDANSDGGTFVNGRRLAKNEIQKLSVGDSVMLADRCYRFMRMG